MMNGQELCYSYSTLTENEQWWRTDGGYFWSAPLLPPGSHTVRMKMEAEL